MRTSARRAGRPRAALAALLSLAAGLVACAIPQLSAPPVPDQELRRRFDAGQVRLDCARCRYDFRNADWFLEQGEFDALVLGIQRSGDGSGRSWYLLGRVAEATDRRELALRYYQESLATRRTPIIPLWPLYEDVSYRLRRLAGRSAAPAAGAVSAVPSPLRPEQVSVDSLVVATRPGAVGAFVAKLQQGDTVDVLDRSGDWEEVRLADGRVGWVFGAYTWAPGSEPPAKTEVAKATPSPKKAKRAHRKTASARSKQKSGGKPEKEVPAPTEATLARAAEPSEETAAAKSPESESTPQPAAEAVPSETTVAAKSPEPEPAPQPAPADAAPTGTTVAAKSPEPEPAPQTAAVKPPAARPAPKARAAKRSSPAKKTTSKALAQVASALQPGEKATPGAVLAASGSAGILGCPLPRGASLSSRSPGSAGAGDHPTETYAIDAPAEEIIGFYEREMERAGWRKSFAASDFLLYFEKDEQMVGILVERNGGLFTLMGS